jgi:hypothetical protein
MPDYSLFAAVLDPPVTTSSCCRDFETHQKNLHRPGFSVYASCNERGATLLLHQTDMEEGSHTAAIPVRFCPWCGAKK